MPQQTEFQWQPIQATDLQDPHLVLLNHLFMSIKDKFDSLDGTTGGTAAASSSSSSSSGLPAPSIVSTKFAGLVPALPGDATKVFKGDGSYGAPLALDTNGTPNSSQSTLNLKDGSGAHVTEAAGTVTIVVTKAAPASSASAGTAGDLAYDSGFLYVCVSANSWKRIALSAF